MSVDADVEQPELRLIGEVLANRYQIESRIGEGAMGAVYRAKHVKVGRAFAVKVLHSRLLVDEKILQRFEREAELAARLRHPNVIGVVDVGETQDGMRYMVMDFAEGPDLATLMSEAPMPPKRIIHLVRQMLEGLYHAHEAGLIHRDFKPENVIIERDTHGAEVPRIVDFGIAILREGGDSSSGPGRLTTNGLVLGTPHYMAPEQAVADPIDHRIDLFALGIMIYEMLCGRLPFDGTGAEVARANLLLDPPPISQRVPSVEVDPLLEAFARRLMAKKREVRPATAKVARDLLDLIERDREAAAAALGIPLADATRVPAATQAATPVRHGDHDGTFPPPFRGEGSTPRLAPAMGEAAAVPARDEQRASTLLAEPVKRRTPMIAALVAGLAILGGAAAVLIAGGKDGDSREVAQQGEQVAVAEPAPVEVPVEAPPAPVEEPTLEEPKVEAPVEGPEKVETPADLVDTARPARPTPRPGKTTGKTTAKVEIKKPAEAKPAEVAPVEAKPVDAGTLAAQYQRVGAQLKALDQAKGADATSDLWARYRLIRIADAMSTQAKRDEAAAVLGKLATEIAKRR